MSAVPNRLSTPPIVRLSHPLAFAAFMTNIGAPVKRHFRSERLPVYCDDPDTFVPLRSAWGLFDNIANAEDPALGWHVGQFVGERNLNADFLQNLVTAPTLYKALQKLVELVGLEASHLQLGILEREDDILFYTHYPNLKHVRGYDSSQAYQLPVILSIIRHFLGSEWLPPVVGIESATVPAAAKECFPGSRILPGQKTGYLVIPRRFLHVPPLETEMHGQISQELRLASEFSYDETLAVLLTPYLPYGYPAIRHAADLMDTSVRTLSRRLAALGTSYRDVVDELRFEIACYSLRTTSERIGDIANAVGFEDASHFSRMFRRVGGLSPRQYRKAMDS